MIKICNKYCYFISAKLITNQILPFKNQILFTRESIFCKAFTYLIHLQIPKLNKHKCIYNTKYIICYLHFYFSQVTFNMFITFNFIILLAIPITMRGDNSEILLKKSAIIIYH